MYDDNRFAKHPRFRFFAFNTEMRWRALQTGRVYVKQHPGDAQLSLDELRDMVGRGTDHLQLCVHSIREYQNFPNSYLLFTKVSMHLSISYSLCSAVHNYDSLCRRSSRSPIMLSILLVIIFLFNHSHCTFTAVSPLLKKYFWSRGGPRATRKRKPAHLKFKGHMRWRYGYVANASLAVTTSVFTVKIALVTTVFITTVFTRSTMENEERPRSKIT